MSAAGNYITESDVSNWDELVSTTATFEDTVVDVTLNTIVVGEDIPTGSIIQFTSDGELPSPLVYGQTYYAIRVDATTLKVATSAVNAAAGTAVDITDDGSDDATHTINVGDGSTETARQEAINRAEKMIEAATRDIFYAMSFEQRLDGNGKDRIHVGFRYNIISITSIEIAGEELPSDLYLFDDHFVFLDPEAATADEVAELHFRLRNYQSLFPVGTSNIVITGTCGHASVPAGVKLAAKILAEAENDPTLYQTYSFVQTEQLETFAYTAPKKVRTGVVEADRVLVPFFRRKPMFGAI